MRRLTPDNTEILCLENLAEGDVLNTINAGLQLIEHDIVVRPEVQGHRHVRIDIRGKLNETGTYEFDALMTPVLPKHTAIATTCVRDGKRLLIKRGINANDAPGQQTISDVLVPKKRPPGRPKGSKNKPKDNTAN